MNDTQTGILAAFIVAIIICYVWYKNRQADHDEWVIRNAKGDFDIEKMEKIGTRRYDLGENWKQTDRIQFEDLYLITYKSGRIEEKSVRRT